MQNSFDKIPDGFLKKWQEIADLIANIMNVPAALIMKTENEFMEVFTSSKTENNPYKVGDKEHWYGLYCETVIKTQKKLRIPNALKDKNWDKNPDIKLGMIAYLGYPINFPDKTPFGTICVLDNKERQFSAENEKLLLQFKKAIELDLALIFSLGLKEKYSHADIIQKLSHDKEELLKAKQKTEESEETYRNLFHNAQVGLFRTRISDGKILESNEQLAKMFGYDDREEFVSEYLTSGNYVDAGTRERMVAKIKENGFVQNFEARFYRKDKSIFWARYSARIYPDKGWIEGVAEDITEHKISKEALKKEKAWSENIVNNAPNIIVGLGERSKIFVFNHYAERLTGYKAEEVIGKEWIGIFIPEELKETIYRVWDEITKNKLIEHYFENEIITKSGDRRLIAWSNTILTEDGKFRMILSIGVDITKRKQAEMQLQESENLLNETGKIAKVGGWELDAQTKKVSWTEETYRMHEVPLEYEPPLQEAINFFHPEDRGKLTDAIERALEKGEPYDLEFRFITGKGKQLWTRSVCEPQIVDGKVVKLKGIFHDITARKKAEEELKKQYTLLQIAGETARFGGWDVDLEKNISNWSDSVADIHEMPHGYAPPVQEGINFYAPEWREKITQVFTACAEKGIPYDEEMEIITKTGKRVWVRTIGRAVKDEKGKIIRVEGSFQDISEQKQAEDARKESDEKYRNLFHSSIDGIAESDLEGKIVACNKAYLEMTGHSEEEIKSLTYRDVTPERWANVDRKHIDQCLNRGYSDPYEKERIRKDGTVFPISIRIWLRSDSEGNPLGFWGIVSDITDRKRAGKALQESEQRFRSIYENVAVGLAQVSLDFKIIRANEAYCKMLGYDEHELVGKQLSDITHPEILEENLQKQKLLAAGKIDHYRMEKKFIHKNGNTVIGILDANLIRDIDGHGIYFLGSVADITDRKRAEEQLRESEAKFKSVFESANVGKSITQPTGEINVNKAFCDMLGYTPAELQHKKWQDITPAEEVESIHKILAPLLKGKKDSARFEKRYIHKNGSIVWVDISVAIYRNAEGKPLYFLTTVVDITKRKQAEEELRKLKDDLEIQVAEKTKELKERVKELERYHDATVNREFRIKELRDEIERLKKINKKDEI